jgi:hypothetical protein
MKEEMIDVPGETLNRRLNEQMRLIERAGILLEELKVDPGEPIAISKGDYRELSGLLSQYEEFLEHFKETTEELVKDVRGMVGNSECFEGERDEDEIFFEHGDEDEDELE